MLLPPDHELSNDGTITNISTIESTNESNSNNDTTQELNDTTNIASINEEITNQTDPNTINKIQPKDNNSEQLSSNDSKQSTLEGNAESHTNQTPITSTGWDFNNSILGSTSSALKEQARLPFT